VEQFIYVGMTITKQNLIQEEIECRFNSGNACYLSVQNLLSSRPLSSNIKIRIYKTIILLVVLLFNFYKKPGCHVVSNVV
jgi:hypothetical protein